MDNRIPGILKKYMDDKNVNDRKENDVMAYLSFEDWRAKKEHYSAEWITVARRIETPNESLWTQSCLVKGTEKNIARLIKSAKYDIESTFGLSAPAEVEENIRLRGVKLVPFILRREFRGLHHNEFEFIQHFLLHFNAFWEEKSAQWMRIDDDAILHTLARHKKNYLTERYGEETLEVDVHALKMYLASRKAGLIRYHDLRRRTETDISAMIKGKYVNMKLSEDRHGYSVDLRTDIQYDDTKSTSRLIGKDLVNGYSAQEYEQMLKDEEVFLEFIIGRDERGKEITCSCDPAKLSSYFTDKNSPHFLTPVYFKPAVLLKYYHEPRLYTVDEYQLMYLNQWSIDHSMNKERLVCVYLGDIGNSLSYEEQLHWKQFNVQPKGDLPYYRFQSDFMAEWISSGIEETPVSHFNQALEELQEAAMLKWNQPVFLPLKEEDKHIYKTIRVPLIEEQAEMDEQVLSMAKILNDSINVRLLTTLTGLKIQGENANGKKMQGSLALLEEWLQTRTDATISAQIMTPFNLLQSLRSSGSAHRKGDNYQKALKKFNLEALPNYIKVRDTLIQLTLLLKKIKELL